MPSLQSPEPLLSGTLQEKKNPKTLAMECKLILGLYIFQYAKIKLIREHFTLPARYPRWLSEFNFCCCASNLTKAERPGSCGLQFQLTVHYCEEVKVETRQRSVSPTHEQQAGWGEAGCKCACQLACAHLHFLLLHNSEPFA